MKPASPQVAGYGLYYRANNHLIPKIADRLLLQCLIDMVRPQLKQSLHNQTIFTSNKQLGRISGMDSGKTIPSSLERLESLGLIQRHTNAVTVNCDLYVTLIQHYETLSAQDRAKFVDDFISNGPNVLDIYNLQLREMSRAELLGMVGSSISVDSSVNDWKLPTILETEVENVGNLQSDGKLPNMLETSNLIGFIQHLMQQMAKTLETSNTNWTFPTLLGVVNVGNLQSDVILALKTAFETGKLPDSVIFDPQKRLEVSNFMIGSFQLFAQKTLEVSNTVIIEDKKRNKGDMSPKIEDENLQDNQKNIFDGWGQVSIVDLDNPSEEDLENSEPIEDFNMEVSRKRASRILKNRNPYKNKPFFKIKRVEEIVEVLDEVIKSPVEFFIYNFVWGLYDLYCDHYQPSRKYDEQGDEIVEPQDYNWKEMVGALLPQDEVCSLALNIYEDLQGAFEQGYYEMVDESGNTWKHTFSFDTLEEFNPVQIFQWEPYKMQDKVTPAFKIAIDKFYDIEAEDALLVSKTITKEDKQRHTNQDKTFIELIRNADNSQLTPMEKAVKKFYDDFVVLNDEGYIEQFLDGKGEQMEGNGRLPDFKIKPWCVGRRIKYADFVDMFAVTYKPCDGLPKRAYIFSAERVVRWNELNGYRDSIAHQALQA